MTTKLITRKNEELELNDNILSGETYNLRGVIKEYLGGKWLPASQAWAIDLEKLAKYLKANSIGLRIVETK